MYKLLYTNESKKNIKKYSKKIQIQLKEDIEKLSDDPEIGKKLKRELKGLHSLRSGDYRIIYSIRRKEIIILILTINHRKDVYKKLKH